MNKFAVLAVCAALAACGSKSDNKSGVTAKIGDTEISVNAKAELPAGYDVYPGAGVISNSKLANAQSTDFNVVMETSDDPDKVVAYYAKEAAAGGFTVPATVKDDTVRSATARTDSGNIFSVNAFRRDDGKTNATLYLEIKGS